MNRRAALANLSALGIGSALSGRREARAAQGGAGRRRSKLRKIATEEACAIPEVVNALREVVRAGGSNLDLPLLKTIYDAPAGTEPRFLPELLDLEGQRLADMDRNGVDVQVLSLTAPGVQMFDADTATSLAIVGADNIMWAIDYPYQPTAPAVSFIESAPMSEDHRERIAYKNAERIFRITAGR